jgi:hypothetical protein
VLSIVDVGIIHYRRLSVTGVDVLVALSLHSSITLVGYVVVPGGDLSDGNLYLFCRRQLSLDWRIVTFADRMFIMSMQKNHLKKKDYLVSFDVDRGRGC